AALLRTCPEVRVLATSREALGITGEIAWRVPSLAVPDPQRLPPFAELEQNPAVRLFVERAAAVQSQFVLIERNAAAVAQVCQRLDGIPPGPGTRGGVDRGTDCGSAGSSARPAF